MNIPARDDDIAEEAYWLYQPHAYAVILQDKNKERLYRVIEPELTPRERIILEETHETLRDVLVYDKPVSRGDFSSNMVKLPRLSGRMIRKFTMIGSQLSIIISDAI
jgi:hypothetical protein